MYRQVSGYYALYSPMLTRLVQCHTQPTARDETFFVLFYISNARDESDQLARTHLASCHFKVTCIHGSTRIFTSPWASIPYGVLTSKKKRLGYSQLKFLRNGSNESLVMWSWAKAQPTTANSHKAETMMPSRPKTYDIALTAAADNQLSSWLHQMNAFPRRNWES